MEFLLEIYGEEIPARFQKKAIDALSQGLVSAFAAQHITVNSVDSWITPCRMGFCAVGVTQHPVPPIEKKGPLLSAPATTVDGFLKANGLTTPSQCLVMDSPKGQYYLYRHDVPTPPLAESIAQAVTTVLTQFKWEKSMRWHSSQDRAWVRPIHHLLCVLDGAVVPLSFLGIVAGNKTKGHKILSPNLFSVTSFASYQEQLRHAFVQIRFDDRLSIINEQVQAIAHAQGLTAQEDMGLYGEIAGLVEYPVPLLGRIDAVFMDLPAELLILVMKTHQRYIALRDSITGALAPWFICVSNIPDTAGRIAAGNERVLRARFYDGAYLFKKDSAQPLADRLTALEALTFFETPDYRRSMAEKAKGVSVLAGSIAQALGDDVPTAVQAGLLAKCDLITATVVEFPELQGIIGGYLAVNDGLPARISNAIANHYKPQGAGDALPAQGLSSIIALADKLDTLAYFFSIGVMPTSSSDPYGLRRAALGVIRIVLDYRYPWTLADVLSLLPTMPMLALEHLKAFFHDRLFFYFKTQFNPKVVSLCIYGRDTLSFADFYETLKARHHLFESADGHRLIALFKRLDSIIPKDFEGVPVDVSLLTLPAEKALYTAIPSVMPSLSTTTMAILALEEPLTDFFDTVMVHVDDGVVRQARLSLLKQIYDLSTYFGDIRQIF